MSKPAADVSAEDRTATGAIDVYASAAQDRRARISYRVSRSDSSNIGVDEITRPEAGLGSSLRSRVFQATAGRIWERVAFEPGVLADVTDWDTRANSNGLGIAVIGSFTVGGNPTTASASHRLRWTSRQALHVNSKRPWDVGVTIAGRSTMNVQTPNAAGLLQFETVDAYAAATSGGATGTLLITRTNGPMKRLHVTISPHIETVLAQGDRFEIRAGVRGDYQSGFATSLSPRISAAAEWAGFNLAAGIGLFAGRVPDMIFLNALANDGRHVQQFTATHVPLSDAGAASLTQVSSVRSRLAADFTHSTERMTRVSIERPFGPFLEFLHLSRSVVNIIDRPT